MKCLEKWDALFSASYPQIRAVYRLYKEVKRAGYFREQERRDFAEREAGRRKGAEARAKYARYMQLVRRYKAELAEIDAVVEELDALCMLLVPRIGHERIVGADSVSTANADYPGGLGAGPEDFLSTGFTHGDGDGAGAGAAAAMAAADEDDDHDDDDHDDDDDDDDFGDDDINWEDDDLEEVRGKCCGAKEAVLN